MGTEEPRQARSPRLTPEAWSEVGRVFEAASEMDPEQRAAFLAETCGRDSRLREEVESLLQADGMAGGLLDELAREEEPLLDAGQRLGRYVIVGELASGGMGEVYRARDTRLDRDVAIKVLRGAGAVSAEALGRFEREAKAVAALSSPSIVHLYDVGEHAGRPFIVMELLEGTTLKETIRAGPLSPDLLLPLAVDIAEALEAAHAKAIIHRDIKPSNVFVTAKGRAKLLDFGIAKLASEAGGETDAPSSSADGTLTRSGLIPGTPSYMSPEQARGERLDGRSDLYSFGLCLYEMATGLPAPDVRASLRRREAVLTPPIDTSGLAAELAAPIVRCLQQDREQRYRSAAELLVDLRALRDALPRDGRPVTPHTPMPSMAAARTGAASRLRTFAGGWVDWISTTSPMAAMLAALASGLLLASLSVVCGVSSFEVGGKAVGYLQVIDWGALDVTVIWPFVVYFLWSSLHGIERFIEQAAGRGMIVGLDFSPADPRAATRSWRELLVRAVPWYLVLVLVCMTLALREWFLYSGLPLARDSVSLAPDSERDWSVAALLGSEVGGSVPSPLVNGLFSFTAYLFAGAIGATMMGLITVLLCLAWWLDPVRLRQSGLRLVPDVHDPDARRGFQLLAPPLASLSFCVLLTWVYCFNIRVADLYLNGNRGANTFEFVLDSLRQDPLRWDPILWSAVVALATVIAVAAASVVVLIVLGQTAQLGRDDYRLHLRGSTSRPCGTPAELAALEAMETWPLPRFARPTSFAAIAAVMVATMVVFRLGLWELGAIALVLTGRAIGAPGLRDRG